MKTFDMQSVELRVSFDVAFAYISEPKNLPHWARGFKSVSNGRALLETENASVEIRLITRASHAQGTIDWIMRFPDGSVSVAYSRLIEMAQDRILYVFVLLPPPIPLEQWEGALAAQSETLREDLAKLSSILASRKLGVH